MREYAPSLVWYNAYIHSNPPNSRSYIRVGRYTYQIKVHDFIHIFSSAILTQKLGSISESLDERAEHAFFSPPKTAIRKINSSIRVVPVSTNPFDLWSFVVFLLTSFFFQGSSTSTPQFVRKTFV